METPPGTPRTLEACARMGVDLRDLSPPSPSFYTHLLGPHAPQPILRLYQAYYLKRSLYKRDLVLNERKSILQNSKSHANSHTKFDFEAKTMFLVAEERKKIALMRKKQAQIEEFQVKREEIEAESREKFRLKDEKMKLKSEMWEKQVKMAQIEENARRKRDEERKKREEMESEEKLKLLKQTQFEQEQKKRENDLREEKKRKLMRKMEAESLQKRQLAFHQRIEAIQSQHQAEVQARLRSMQLRDRQRLETIHSHQQLLKLKHDSIHQLKQKRMQKARRKLEQIREQVQEEFEEKLRKSGQKRKEFEEKRERKRRELQEKARKKQENIEKVVEQAEFEVRKKREIYLKNMRKAEMRLKALEFSTSLHQNQRILLEKEKEKSRISVKNRQKSLEKTRQNAILHKIKTDENRLNANLAKKSWESRILQEKHKILRLEREDEVERVEKMRIYRQNETKKRLKLEDLQSERVKSEQMRLKAEREKIKKEFEGEKNRVNSGKRPKTSSTLRETGSSETIFSDFKEKKTNFSDILREIRVLEKEKKRVLRAELKKEYQNEDKREQILAKVTDLEEKERLESLFGVERAQTLRRFDEIRGKFESDMERLRRSLE